MKKIRLILETYRQNVVPSILVLVIMTISLLVMTVSLGQYRLSTYTLDLLAHAGLENADYFMQELSGPGSLDEACVAGEIYCFTHRRGSLSLG